MGDAAVKAWVAEIEAEVWEHVEEIDAARPEWQEVIEAMQMPGVRYKRVRGYELYGGVKVG